MSSEDACGSERLRRYCLVSYGRRRPYINKSNAGGEIVLIGLQLEFIWRTRDLLKLTCLLSLS